MNIANKRNELPPSVLAELENANIYYSEPYYQYVSKTSRLFYLYDDSYIQVVQCNTIKKIFHQATYPSELYSLKGITSFKEMQYFLDVCSQYLKDIVHVDWLIATSPTLLYKAFPSSSKRIPFGNYVIDLRKDEEEIFASFSSGHRKDCRKAEKDGVIVKFGNKELLEEYLSIDKELWNRNGQNKDNGKRYSMLLDGMPENTVIGLAYKDNVLQCGRLGFYNKAMYYCMYSATANNHVKGAANLLHYEYMKEMKRRGVNAYNFVGCRINVDKGSKPANIQFFKSRFGGDLVVCYLFKTIFSPIKRFVFESLLRIKGLKDVDILDQEIYKWKYLNEKNHCVNESDVQIIDNQPTILSVN